MRNNLILEAARYSMQPRPLKCDIYRSGGTSYSNFRGLVLAKEAAIPNITALKEGILADIQAYWCSVCDNLEYSLHLFRYDLNTLEILPNFTSPICAVCVCVAPKSIFNEKIQNCLVVATETDVIMYGIEADTNCIINTDFSTKLPTKPTCVETVNGKLFVGGADGHVYQITCKSIELLGYRYLSVCSSGGGVLGTIKTMLRRRKNPITQISVGEKYLVALAKGLEVYNADGGLYKLYSIDVEPSYSRVQIVEENPLLFYCVQGTGQRDFYTTELVHTRDPVMVESSEHRKITRSTATRFLSISASTDRSVCTLCTFNEDQLYNFGRTRPVENSEVLTVPGSVRDAVLTDVGLYLLARGSVVHYSLLDARATLVGSNTQEIYQIYRNYGDVEFMVKYFELLTESVDVARLEGLCKNESIRTHALFVWIYKLVAPVWKVDLVTLKGSAEEAQLDRILKKLKMMKTRLPFGYDEARSFIEEFVQTWYYVAILVEYKIEFSETFESIMTSEDDFKTETLKKLLDAYGESQQIEALLKTMQNHCPLYLPVESMNMQRGMQLIKEGDRESMERALGYLVNAKFDQGVIQRFNSYGYFYGSAVLIKEKFDFDFETAVYLFRESIKCKRAFEVCLEDTREDFLYAFFEAVIRLEAYVPCICCDVVGGEPDMLSIKNPLFKLFLKDSMARSERACSLYWKYLLFRNEKTEAIEALLNQAQRDDIVLEKKAEHLRTALSLSAGTALSSEVRLRMRLYEIQTELMGRSAGLKTSRLLDTETLYNDYCVGHDDLQIKVLDAVNYADQDVLRMHFARYFETIPLRECFVFLRELANKKLSTVFDILLKNVKPHAADFCAGLSMAGFEYEEIVNAVRDSLDSGVVSPAVKAELLRSLKAFARFDEYKECERRCAGNFGIKI